MILRGALCATSSCRGYHRNEKRPQAVQTRSARMSTAEIFSDCRMQTAALRSQTRKKAPLAQQKRLKRSSIQYYETLIREARCPTSPTSTTGKSLKQRPFTTQSSPRLFWQVAVQYLVAQAHSNPHVNVYSAEHVYTTRLGGENWWV